MPTPNTAPVDAVLASLRAADSPLAGHALAELLDPDAGPGRAYALVAALPEAGRPSGATLLAGVRWLAAAAAAAAGILGDGDAARRLRRRLEDDLGSEGLQRLLTSLARRLPGLRSRPAAAGDATETPVLDTADPGLLGLTVLALALRNPALAPLSAPFGWRGLDDDAESRRLLDALPAGLATLPVSAAGRNAWEILHAPVAASPDDLDRQLLATNDAWGPWLGELGGACAVAAGLLREETRPRFEGPGVPAVFEAPTPSPPQADAAPEAPVPEDEETERFSVDRAWMPRLVLMAKNAHVWLDQLSRGHGREIRSLDRIPGEELDRLAAWGVTGLWLIGLWQRSAASREIKRRMGNPEALASAYAIDDYRIADDLGGDAALDDLRWKAMERGIRLCGDMVPNHTGVDGRWVRERPELFLQVDRSPYPGYTFQGPDLSSVPEVEITLEDHYWDRSDAAVVFRHRDRRSGRTRYIYHGNDGTSMPWNDTAQLDYLNPETREAVIEAILDVARRFPVIRFDAAMVLARRHVRRLWYPEAGQAGDVASRAAHAMTREDFDAAMPREFWREVVDRVAAEAPDTLLLAEAFWLMEGYFVRTLGMHRVYNSAFMHMLRDQDNAAFRASLRNVLDFDARILQRFVNFLTNPDEETAVEQFGQGDKYFEICTLLATLPGLPLLGHGQFEGHAEKYGMEYARAYRGEEPDVGLLAHHERMIVPLLRDRRLFAGADRFRLYDAIDAGGEVVDDLIVFSNGDGEERVLVIANNSHEPRRGRVHRAFGPGGSPGVRLADELGLSTAEGTVVLRDPRLPAEQRVSAAELNREGLRVDLPPYGCRVYTGIAVEA